MPKRAVPGPRPTRGKAAGKAGKAPTTAAGARVAPERGNGRTKARTPSGAAGRNGSATSTKRPANAVTIRSESGASMTIPFGPTLQQAAVEWVRVVQHRARWATQADARLAQAQRAIETLERLDVKRKAIESLGASRVVQVTVPFVEEAVGWEARIFPWEYVLSAALREGRVQPFVVVRHLDRQAPGGPGPGTAAAPAVPPTKGLIIESAPPELRANFSFESERHLVAAKLRPLEVEKLPDPSPDQARDHIKRINPHIVHLAGFDTHQGLGLLKEADSGYDGYLMLDERGRPLPVKAEDLGAILTAGSPPPRLVACNFQNSASRVASLAVAAGAQAAIGFQDRVDDAVAEAFFALYYAELVSAGWDVFAAFERSFQELARVSPEALSGTGFVLWSATDVLAGLAGRRAAEAAMPQAVAPPVGAAPPAPEAAGVDAGASPGSQLTTQLPVEQATPGVASIIVSSPDVWVKPSVIRRVNYSLLHNDRALFDSFAIHNTTGQPVEGVTVEVTLYAGGDSFPYRRSLRLEGPVTELKRDIRVPLTSSLLRGVRESLQSVVYISVKRGPQSLYEDTVPVSLVPIEEWSSADADEMWLPSFVLPRDPAVDQVVQTALALLRTLRDDPTASFDGYQSVDQNRNDPYELVDYQVRALWGALAFHLNLAYINPPPTYSSRAQRLRTPSAILASRAGTCVDLALLLASCLEYVEIYPVVVLYDGHASVGYWRGNDLHQAFQVVKPSSLAGDGASKAAGDGAGGDGGDEVEEPVTEAAGITPAGAPLSGSDLVDVPWVLRRQSRTVDPVAKELRARVSRGELSLLEATAIPLHRGFHEAQQLGEEGLRQRAFRSLIDIEIARRNGVTPLPVESR
jgi:hypothetical protein